MDRKEFLASVGNVALAALLVPACIGGLTTSCSREDDSVPTAPSNVNFTVDVSTGNLATNGGFIVTQGIIIARTTSGTFLAVSAACTHAGTNVNYVASSNSFLCPNHGATFSSTGAVTKGPATTSLKQYTTSLSGNTLTVTG